MNAATAASMDGYTAFGASIEKDNKKQTLTCPAPRAVLADVDVLVNAPERMTASGYADLLGKVTAGMAVVAVTTPLTRPKFREGDVLDRRWVVDDPETLRDVVRRRIEAADGRKGVR